MQSFVPAENFCTLKQKHFFTLASVTCLKGFFKNINNISISTGALCAWSPIFGCVFPCWLFALHLLAHLLVSQQSPVELGGSDYPVRSADPPAAGGIWHLQSGTLTNLTQIAHAFLSLVITCVDPCFALICVFLCFQAKTEISANLSTMLK